MKKVGSIVKNSAFRRLFLKSGMIAAGDATTGSGLLPGSVSAFEQAGDEILEADPWEQYWELSLAAGIKNRRNFGSGINPNTGAPPAGLGGNAEYTAALQLVDGDTPRYFVDNADDEFSHVNFLLAYLKSKGANTADLDLLDCPTCSIIHPTETEVAAMAAGQTLTRDGLFIGQTREFMQLLDDLAANADQA